MATEPDSIAICLGDDLTRIERIGLEAGPLSEWLVRELSVLGIVVTLLETRQVRAALSAMIIKTDRKDARGMAHLLRTGWFRPVPVKSLSAREQRAMLAARSMLVAPAEGHREQRSRTASRLRPSATKGLAGPLGGRCSRGNRRSPYLGADFRTAAHGPRSLAGATDHTRQAGSGCRAGGSRLSAAHERSGRRRDCRDDVQSRRRSTGSLPIIQAGGCLLRPDSSKISIRRDRPKWLHQPRRRCIGPGCAIRSRARHHDAGCSLVEAQGLGHERGQAARCQAGQGRPRPQAGGRPSPDVGR